MTASLAAALRAGTRDLHRAAEQSGIMRQILVERRLTRPAYARLLRSLHAHYAALEGELARHAAHPALAPLHFPELARAEALAADLRAHHGAAWEVELAPAPTAIAYAARLRALGAGAPALLAAHAYVRYLGDLSGGQLLAPLVAGLLGVAPNEGFAFYAFAGVPDVAGFRVRYRAALDAVPLGPAASDGPAPVVEEARHAFALHARLFEELAQP
jgi:heme oxygenase